MYQKPHLYAIAVIGLIIVACTICNIFNNVHILDAGNIFLLILYVCFTGAYILIYRRVNFKFAYSWITGIVCYLLTIIFSGLALYNNSWNVDSVYYLIPFIIAITLTHICFVNFSATKGFMRNAFTLLLKITAVITAVSTIALLFTENPDNLDFMQKFTASLVILLIFGDFMVFYINYFYSLENNNNDVLTLYKSDKETIYADKFGKLYHVIPDETGSENNKG